MIITKLKRINDFFKNFICANKCIYCKKRMLPDEYSPLCGDCLKEWYKELDSLCPTCGQKLTDCWCGIYDDKDHIIERESHLIPYLKGSYTRGKRMIIKCKYSDDTRSFDFLAPYLAEKIDEFKLENSVLCYVPRSKKNYIDIGHDQSYELCKRISKITNIEYSSCLINKGKKEQKTLTHNQRLQNAKSTFSFDRNKREDVKGKNVILIDDLVTTGATVTRCAVLLKRNYAQSVSVISIGKSAR